MHFTFLICQFFGFSPLHSMPSKKLRIRPVKPTKQPAAKIHYWILFRDKNFIHCILMLETCTHPPFSWSTFTPFPLIHIHICTRFYSPRLLALISPFNFAIRIFVVVMQSFRLFFFCNFSFLRHFYVRQEYCLTHTLYFFADTYTRILGH